MRNFWFGFFLGALIGLLLLAPEANISMGISALFATLADSVAAVFAAVGDATYGVADSIQPPPP